MKLLKIEIRLTILKMIITTVVFPNYENYEIVLMFTVGEDSLTDQTIEKYKSVVSENGGTIGLLRRIGDHLRWHMILIIRIKLDISSLISLTDNKAIDTLNEMIKFNDHIIRHLVLNTKNPQTEPSFMNKEQLKSA